MPRQGTPWSLGEMAANSETNLGIPIEISVPFVLQGQFKNKPPLVQKMVWHRTGDKSSSKPLLSHIWVFRSPGGRKKWGPFCRRQFSLLKIFVFWLMATGHCLNLWCSKKIHVVMWYRKPAMSLWIWQISLSWQRESLNKAFHNS